MFPSRACLVPQLPLEDRVRSRHRWLTFPRWMCAFLFPSASGPQPEIPASQLDRLQPLSVASVKGGAAKSKLDKAVISGVTATCTWLYNSVCGCGSAATTSVMDKQRRPYCET